ncbi:MAG: class I SAM-dependent methyltransferase [Bacteroidia bacterium]|nr:class I SAM-dependent methyltransferase [Bacteroidia bacterium]NNF31118.1 class I SAM-dependent methyltransferase [Flavobacteriaceae bacterium]NNK55580.1 class I SAM-dependent methyltransferase [Flavobacteriaceae bacterium]NNM08870.1 class I SAM-dependent methyltransferase [Flavobacteriaceae bacterium]
MLSSSEKSLYRSELFRHLDGIAVAPVVQALDDKGVLDYLLKEGKCLLSTITEKFNANEGYLNIGLRMLASQGWLEYDIKREDNTITISTNSKSSIAFSLANSYEDVVNFMKISSEFHPRHFERDEFSLLNRIFNKYRNGAYASTSNDTLTKEIEFQIEKHIEGVLVGPITVFLGMDGMFHKYFMEASFSADEFHEDPDSFSKILDFFTYLEWFTKKNGHYRFTNKGLFFARRSTAYGVTVSYIPTFRRVDELMFGNALIFKSSTSTVSEIHVDREMNVWGSGGAHSAYFKKIDEIIITLFNKPIEEQPKGILDMGCGNGAFLIHLFEVIEQRTHRGTMLEEYPLFLVGVDFNRAALKATRANLVKADIWAKVIWGDIGNPEQLEEDIQANYDINLEDLLNVRTFLDHNRPWSMPQNFSKDTTSLSTGAFSSGGLRLHNAMVEQNLKEHFENWKKYIGKFGLLLIELHTIDPKIAAQYVGKTAATAYDATHGFSDQYILELDVFNHVLSEIGLSSDPNHLSKFPKDERATVSIHYLTVNN